MEEATDIAEESIQPCRPLWKVLEDVEDPRLPKGKRYSLVALLSLCCAGMLCGCRTYSAIAQWGRECDVELARTLGFSVVTTAGIERRPSAATLFFALRDLDRQALEVKLGQWMQEVLASIPAGKGYEGLPEAIAVDGKTLRGSAKQLSQNGSRSVQNGSRSVARQKKRNGADRDEFREDVPGVHLLSALSHRLGLPLGQCEVSDKTNEITVMPELLRGLMLEGRVLTMDALLTQRTIAEEIMKKKGTT
jgi:hypothetical protein